MSEVRIDPRAVEPFNSWWRQHARQATPPNNPEVVKAFDAGFKAGMRHAVDAACEIIKAHPESRS